MIPCLATVHSLKPLLRIFKQKVSVSSFLWLEETYKEFHVNQGAAGSGRSLDLVSDANTFHIFQAISSRSRESSFPAAAGISKWRD